MQKTWEEYRKLIINGTNIVELIDNARSEHLIETNPNLKENYIGSDIPFNLERIYLDELILNKKYDEAQHVLKRMRHSYADMFYQNTIESFEYHLRSIIQSEEVIKDFIIKAKKEFNQHTITLISIIVGVITIFGSANGVFTLKSYQEMFFTFVTIVISVIAVILTATFVNIKYTKK